MRHKLPPAKYTALKVIVLERDDYSCVACGNTETATPHHIISRGMGGGDYEENIVTLCIPCHQDIEQGRKEVPNSVLESIGFFNLQYDTRSRTQTEVGNG